MQERIRWGILGTGAIANTFAGGLIPESGGVAYAVGSRTAQSAQRFAAKHGIARAYDSYEALAADPDVDMVYVATPHSFHCENTLMCLDAGKPVLCEKPFALSAAQGERMIARARERGLLLIEAMWTRFLPVMAQVGAWLREGKIGEPRLVRADFGFSAPVKPESRLFNPQLGGGALLDVGVYTIALASMVFGHAPRRVQSSARLGETGVDEENALLLDYPSGHAQLFSAIRLDTPHGASILGDKGGIVISPPFWHATSATLRAGRHEEHHDLPYPGNGYTCEALEAARCLRAGQTESAQLPLDETLGILRIMDAAREQWGLRYPQEGEPHAIR